MGSLGAVRERTFELIEQGEYVFTLNDLQFSSDGKYGDSLKWVWLIAPKDAPTDYMTNANGMEKTLHQYTDADIVVGSRQHEWAQVLSGRELNDGDEPPEDEELTGKRMVGYLTHYKPKQGPNAGKAREKIVEGSCKAFRLPGQKARPASVAQVSADPSDDDVDRALLVSKLQKQVTKLKRLNEEAGVAAEKAMNESDLGTASLKDIEDLLNTITQAVNQALDD